MRPFHDGVNDLHQLFASPEEALTALADAQWDSLDIIFWVKKVITACLALPFGLTGVMVVDRQLISYLEGVGRSWQCNF